MKFEWKEVMDLREIYEYMMNLSFPYNYEVEYDVWERSYLYDVDGEGRTLFANLTTKGAYLDGKLIGMIQYGRTAFGFDENGEISDKVFYSVIRNFYFNEMQKDAGIELLNEAKKAFSNTSERIYAFFHYFGMSCCARHGKLYDGFEYIHNLLEQNGFSVEHENVFYSSVLNTGEHAAIKVRWHNETLGKQQYGDFILEKDVVGGCEIHFPEKENTAYLRWIFINEDMCGKGIGSECMTALKTDLFHRGIIRFDTDTAVTNKVAQHFYDKNGFTKKGITRSYYTEPMSFT